MTFFFFFYSYKVEMASGLLRPWLNIDRYCSVMIRTAISFNLALTFHTFFFQNHNCGVLCWFSFYTKFEASRKLIARNIRCIFNLELST